MINIRVWVYNNGIIIWQREMVVKTKNLSKALAVGVRIAKKKRRDLELTKPDYPGHATYCVDLV